MVFFRSENQSKKILRINKSETEIHSPPGHFLTKRKSDVKSHHQYINQEKKMKQKQEFKKNRDQIGAFISNYRRKPRKQCDKNEKN